jgi:hypothetical protein
MNLSWSLNDILERRQEVKDRKNGEAIDEDSTLIGSSV